MGLLWFRALAPGLDPLTTIHACTFFLFGLAICSTVFEQRMSFERGLVLGPLVFMLAKLASLVNRS